MDILFSIVGGPKHTQYFFYKEVKWPENSPIPRIGENVMIGNLFPCEVTNIFWAVETQFDETSLKEPFLTIMLEFKDNVGILHRAEEEGFISEVHPYFPNF